MGSRMRSARDFDWSRKKKVQSRTFFLEAVILKLLGVSQFPSEPSSEYISLTRIWIFFRSEQSCSTQPPSRDWKLRKKSIWIRWLISNDIDSNSVWLTVSEQYWTNWDGFWWIRVSGSQQAIGFWWSVCGMLTNQDTAGELLSGVSKPQFLQNSKKICCTTHILCPQSISLSVVESTVSASSTEFMRWDPLPSKPLTDWAFQVITKPVVENCSNLHPATCLEAAEASRAPAGR